MYDLFRIRQDIVRKEIEAAEDKKIYELFTSISTAYYLGKALRGIPNTKWKKIKYYTKRLFGLIK